MFKWLKNLVRRDVQAEVKDSLDELRGQIREAFRQAVQEAKDEIAAEFIRPQRTMILYDEPDAEVVHRLPHKRRAAVNGHAK